MAIRYIPYNEIDKAKWDQCIDNASNGLIYAYSFYLDTMARHWDAIVFNDYEAVMPLTWNKKYSIYYLYQPFFCASLGVFGNNLTLEFVNDFLQTIPEKFKFWDIYLNHANNFYLEKFPFYQRKNFVLPLNDSYENIYKDFRDNIKRNIKRADNLKCIIRKNIDLHEVISLAKFQSKTFSPIAEKDFACFEKLFSILSKQNKAITYGVYMSTGELVASCAFFFSNKRAYYILVGNHPNGKTIGASHALINAFIKDHSNRNILLDFEGSDLQNLAFFYSGFGATEEQYVGIKLNRLPFWARWLKK